MEHSGNIIIFNISRTFFGNIPRNFINNFCRIFREYIMGMFYEFARWVSARSLLCCYIFFSFHSRSNHNTLVSVSGSALVKNSNIKKCYLIAVQKSPCF